MRPPSQSASTHPVTNTDRTRSDQHKKARPTMPTTSKPQNIDTHAHKQPPSGKFDAWHRRGFGTELVAVETGTKAPFIPGWATRTITAEDIRVWDKAGHSVGIRTRDHPFMDIDCDDTDTAQDICRATAPTFRVAAMRTRKGSSRFGLLFQLARNEPPFKKFKRVWTRQVSNGATPHTEKFEIEILADGQQFVADGKHPDGSDYEWADAPPLETLLHPVKRSDFEHWFDEIDRIVAKRGWHAQKQRHAGTLGAQNTSGLGTKCPDNSTNLVSEMFGVIPNDLSVDYDQWIRLGMAAKAAGDFFDEWAAWSSTNPINEDTKDNADTWDGFDPQGNIGFGTLVWEATQAGWVKPPELEDYYRELKQKEQEDVQARPAADFEPVSEADTPFSENAVRPASYKHNARNNAWTQTQASLDPYEWLYGDILLRGAVTILAGPGGVSKSTLALGWCLDICLEQKTPWLGRPVRTHGLRCAYLNTDDPLSTSEKRTLAGVMERGETLNTLQDRLYLFDEADLPGGATLANGKLLPWLSEMTGDLKIDILMTDPLVNIAGADENSNTDMIKEMKKLSSLANSRRLAMQVTSHVRKGTVGMDQTGDQNADDIRGGGAIVNLARNALMLRQMTEKEALANGVGREFRKEYVCLGKVKSNHTAYGASNWFHIDGVCLGNRKMDARGTIHGPDYEPVHSVWFPKVTMLIGADADRCVGLVKAGLAPGGEPFSADKRAGAGWVGHMVCAEFGVAEVEVKTIVDALILDGKLVVADHKNKDGKTRKGLFSV